MLQGQPEVAATILQLIGTGAFGAVVGWYVYHVNRNRKDDAPVGAFGTVIGAIGGGAGLSLFPARSDLFGAYGIGLATGFFLYFIFLVVKVKRAPGVDSAWFLDGREHAPAKDQAITPGGRSMSRDWEDEVDRHGFEAIDDGFESSPTETGPDLVNFGFSQKGAGSCQPDF